MFRHVLRFFAACAFVTPALFASSPVLAQSDSESAGHSRGGYAWGEERHEEQAAGPAMHRYGRVFATLGAGGSIRLLRYVDLNQEFVAPAYLQLRGGYFFEGEGMFQHGVVLGVATSLNGDGTDKYGESPLEQWAIAPSYMLRIIPEGDLGNWFQSTVRVGIPFSLGEQFSWGWEVGIGMLLKPWNSVGFYGELDLSMYFAQDYHPLFSFEIGLAFDMEMLP